MNQINKGGLANESLFAIILQTFGEIQNPMRLINNSSTLCDWKRMSSPTSPYVFKEATIDNINIITNLLKENKFAMFLRKVDISFPDEVIKQLMDLDFNHEYEILHNQAKKKSNFDLYYFLLYLIFFIFITIITAKYFMNSYLFTYYM